MAKAKNIVEVITSFGRIRAFDADLITQHIIDFGAHTRPELAFLLSMVDPGDSVFDLGGHIGTFAIPLAQKIGGQGRLLIVEGSPENYGLLKTNIHDSKLAASISLRNALIAPADYNYTSCSVKNNTGATFFVRARGGGSTRARTTVDELCCSYFFPRIIKLDLEGFEMFALASAPALVKTKPIIYAEVSGDLLRRAGASRDELDSLLRSNGYRLFKNAGSRNSPDDNFIVTELRSLAQGGVFFDVLAVHRDDDRLRRATYAQELDK